MQEASRFMGATDIGACMKDAAARGLDVDAFMVMTDNEVTNVGTHAMTDFDAYKRKSGKTDAKLAAVAMTATKFTVADPTRTDCMGFVGQDAAMPQIISDFFGNRLF
jgi:60 kDa SS-A/Ro ribonucleoprotein